MKDNRSHKIAVLNTFWFNLHFKKSKRHFIYWCFYYFNDGCRAAFTFNLFDDKREDFPAPDVNFNWRLHFWIVLITSDLPTWLRKISFLIPKEAVLSLIYHIPNRCKAFSHMKCEKPYSLFLWRMMVLCAFYVWSLDEDRQFKLLPDHKTSLFLNSIFSSLHEK